MDMLNVPLENPLQTDGYSCVPRCVKMILQYLVERQGRTMPNLSIEEIGEIMETRYDGTLPSKVTNLNENSHIMRIIPSVEFIYQQKMHTLSEIKTELQEKKPVIAWVELSDNGHRCGHAVVVTGIDENESLIYYNDPIFGKKEQEISVFISRWERLDRILITVKVGQRRILDEFIGDSMQNQASGEKC